MSVLQKIEELINENRLEEAILLLKIVFDKPILFPLK